MEHDFADQPPPPPLLSSTSGGGINRLAEPRGSPGKAMPTCGLRPVQAVVGQAFPAVRADRHYGRSSDSTTGITTTTTAPAPSDAGSSASAGASPAARASTKRMESAGGLSAHVQPEDDGWSTSESPYHHHHHQQHSLYASPGLSTQSVGNSDSNSSGTDGTVVMPVGGSSAARGGVTSAQQWSPEEFEMLFLGYYDGGPLPQSVRDGVDRLVSTTQEAAGAEKETRAGQRGRGAPHGEAFFDLLFRCLRSTVRKHQELALQALLFHLHNDTAATGALRERCVHGPDCAPFLFFLLEIVASAGHPAVCQLAAAALLALLHTSQKEEEDAMDDTVGAIGPPPGDIADTDREEAISSPAAASTPPTDDPDLPFAEVSELLRGDDAPLGLEKLGFTAKVVTAMDVLLLPPPSVPPLTDVATTTSAGNPVITQETSQVTSVVAGGTPLFASLLLCGSLTSPAVATRLTQDPRFLQFVERQLTDVVVGQQRLSDTCEVLRVLLRLARVPEALRGLLRGTPNLYETWELFMVYVCTTRPEEVRTLREVEAVVLSFEILREMGRDSRSGGSGVLHDIGDTLLGSGLRVGAAMALEVWLLQCCPAGPAATTSHGVTGGGGTRSSSSSSVLDYFKEAAVSALHLYQAPAVKHGKQNVEENESQPSVTDQHRTTAQQALRYLVRLTNAHYLATYLQGSGRTPHCLTLLGSAVETQTRMQDLLASTVLHAEALAGAFARLTAPLPSANASRTLSKRSCMTVVEILSRWTPLPLVDVVRSVEHRSPADSRPWLLAFQAAFTYANTRLAAAVADTYPAVSKDAVVGYAAALAAKFEEGCLNMRSDAARRLQPDELCTMTEVLTVLQDAQRWRSNKLASTASHSAATSSLPPLSEKGRDEASGRANYAREAHVAAVFLLHAMAITKHCLDACPRALTCVLGLQENEVLEEGEEEREEGAGEGNEGDDKENGTSLTGAGGVNGEESRSAQAQGLPSVTASAAMSTSQRRRLAMCLLCAVVRSPVPVSTNAVTGAPRSWVLYPLLDDAYTDKATWGRWVLQTLGLHQRMKYVLGWDALLSHSLVWVMSHRRALFGARGNGKGDKAVANSRHFPKDCGSVLCDVLATLAEMLIANSSAVSGSGNGHQRSDTAFSTTASDALGVSFAAYADAQSEEAIPLALHAVLALVAAHCQPTTTLAVLQVLQVTPVLLGAFEREDADVGAGEEKGSAALSPREARLLDGLLRWSSAVPMGSGSSTTEPGTPIWSLENIVALLQMIAPFIANGRYARLQPCPPPFGSASTSSSSASSSQSTAEDVVEWCVAVAAHGVLCRFVSQRLSQGSSQVTSSPPAQRRLGFMEREVLRSALDDLEWDLPLLSALVNE